MPEMYLNVDWEDNSNNITMLWVDNSKHIDVIQGICLPALAVKLLVNVHEVFQRSSYY